MPSENPTPAPTAVPSVEPTPTPTADPTPVPSAEPTLFHQPTAEPTLEPTPVPSQTKEPIGSPTLRPTPSPTVVPTTKTTSKPTKNGLVSNIDFPYTMSLYNVLEGDWNKAPELFDSVFSRTLIQAMGVEDTMTSDNIADVIANANDGSIVVSSHVSGSAPGFSNEDLKQRLTDAIKSGRFTELLQRNAREQRCDGLTEATAEKPEDDDDANAGKSGGTDTSSNDSANDGVDAGGISGIAVGLLFFICCICGLYLYVESAENQQYKGGDDEIAMVDATGKLASDTVNYGNYNNQLDAGASTDNPLHEPIKVDMDATTNTATGGNSVHNPMIETTETVPAANTDDSFDYEAGAGTENSSEAVLKQGGRRRSVMPPMPSVTSAPAPTPR